MTFAFVIFFCSAQFVRTHKKLNERNFDSTVLNAEKVVEQTVNCKPIINCSFWGLNACLSRQSLLVAELVQDSQNQSVLVTLTISYSQPGHLFSQGLVIAHLTYRDMQMSRHMQFVCVFFVQNSKLPLDAKNAYSKCICMQ